MNIEQQQEAEAEAHAAARGAVISDLRNATALGRLSLGEVRAMLHRLTEQGHTIVKAGSVADAKAKLAALA